ncbi:hypothetical protein WDU94_000795, partial [Cyamophila willieti]
PKCGFVYDDGGLAIAGYVKDKFKTKAETEGPVCPDKCGKELLAEINTNCEANFTAHCVESCEDIPLTDTDPTKYYNNCCIVQGVNKDGDLNCYTFADKDGIFLVNFGGNAFSDH